MREGELLISLMHAEHEHGTLTILGEVTSTNTAVVMSENNRALRPTHTGQVYQEILSAIPYLKLAVSTRMLHPRSFQRNKHYNSG